MATYRLLPLGTRFYTTLFFFIFLMLCVKTSAQIEPMLSKPATRAVIVGISNYENIDDLRYSHRDAEAFARHLLSPAGGSLPEDQIKLLTNEKATAGQIGLAFNWLVKESKEGDRAIIYFSGHGDVETESSDLGYLLAYDAQKTTYMGSGTIAIFALESVIKKLSEKKQAEVILIADACHAGNLAGSEINGSKFTAIALSGELPKVVKIMSCQPEELSQESEVWGGGHSVFSYFLLYGLSGFADANENREVTLREIEGFLYDSVQRSTVALGFRPQSPMKFGNNNVVIANVDAASFAALRSKNSPPQSKPALVVASKNVPVLDSVTTRLYHQFEVALRTGHLLYPEQGAAYSIYQTIKDRPSIQPQIDMMRYALAAAMQDDAQKAINDYLSADPREMRRRWGLDDGRYRLYPQYLEKAAELLGNDNFMYPQLKAREYYFTGLNLRLQGERNDFDTMLFKAAIPFQKKTLALDSTAAYAYNELGLLARRLEQYELSVGYFNKAVRFSPTWVLPWINLCNSHFELGQPDKSEKCGLRAVALDSTFSLAHYNLGYVYMDKKEYAKATYRFERSIEYDSTYALAYYNLGLSYYYDGNYVQAEKIWEEYCKRNPNDLDVILNLGDIAMRLGKTGEAERRFQKVIELDPQYSLAYFSLGELFLANNEIGKSKKWFKDYVALKPNTPEGYFQLAIVSVQRSEESLLYLKTALQKGFKDYERLKNEARFASLHSMTEYKKLVKQYFPGKE